MLQHTCHCFMSSVERRKEVRLFVPLQKNSNNSLNFNFNLILIPIDRSFPQNLMQMLMTMSDDEPEVGEHDQSEDVDKVQSLPEYCHRHHYYRCNRHHDFNRHHLLDHHLQNCNHRHQWPEHPDEGLLRDFMYKVKSTGPAHISLPVGFSLTTLITISTIVIIVIISFVMVITMVIIFITYIACQPWQRRRAGDLLGVSQSWWNGSCTPRPC